MFTLVRYGLLVTLLRPVLTNCPDSSWKMWNGHCYKLTNKPVSWHQLRGECKSPFRQADAASIASDAENTYIQETLAGSQQIWLGMRSHGQSRWWVDNAPVNYTNFAPGAPPAGSSDAVQMEAATGLWKLSSSYDGTKLHGLCKMALCGCPGGWKTWQNRCYLAQHRQLSWVEAHQHCQRLDPAADLTAVRHDQENEYIYGLVAGRFPSWIGLNDRVREANYEWTNNVPFSFHKWRPLTEPDGRTHREDCVGLLGNKTWADYSCSTTVISESYVCQQRWCGPQAPIDHEFTRLGWVRVWRPQDGVRCPSRWSRSGDRCFGRLRTVRVDTFSGARQLCRQLHPTADIATVRSLQDNDQAFLSAIELPAFVASDGQFGVWESGSGGGAGCASLQPSGLWSAAPCASSKQSAVCQVPACTPACPNGWYPFQGFCYRVGETRRTAADAEAACRKPGGHLASILTQEENDFIMTLAFPSRRRAELQSDNSLRHAWIGATRADNTSNWAWRDCNDWTITRWKGRDGNGPSSTDGTCATIFSNGRWVGSVGCDKTFRFVCKMDPCREQFAELSQPICPDNQPTTTTPTTTTSATPSIRSVIFPSNFSKSAAAHSCPDDGRMWVYLPDYCLTLVPAAPAPFAVAFQACESGSEEGRFLVTVPALRPLAQREPLLYLANGTDVWLGLTRRWTGLWYWHDRRHAAPLHWQTPPSEHTRCTAMDARTGGLVARDCSHALPFFCQAHRLF